MPEPPRRSERKLNPLRRIKRLQPYEKVSETLKKGKEEWDHFGALKEYAVSGVYWRELISFLDAKNKPNPQVMVIGPGFGEDIIAFKREMHMQKVFPEVDVFGLTKSLSANARKTVREDYSQNVSLEEVGANPEKYPELVKAMKGKYDAVIAVISAGLHTIFPAQNCFFMAMMLAVGGEAYIQIDAKSMYKTRPRKFFGLKYPGKYYRLLIFKILNMFPRILAIYNKMHGTDYRFRITETYGVGFIKIKRIA